MSEILHRCITPSCHPLATLVTIAHCPNCATTISGVQILLTATPKPAATLSHLTLEESEGSDSSDSESGFLSPLWKKPAVAFTMTEPADSSDTPSDISLPSDRHITGRSTTIQCRNCERLFVVDASVIVRSILVPST
ncbi:hypothetical protein PHLGIDRAFT_169569 [Phlebiopsis gigantea 11061_1 CR5-6]|uniref:Uncharacterized protein n=1 Tax=Phlebiopsis gigantea (strain 11061_1 CR5-6) TaxID=745531 RepID=A0A0C3NJC0_PHLG1|nr:hypothetical protein PHLGIDRAFT_169569 [Phlebiopsis gigantea 11061_1 CR5-6]